MSNHKLLALVAAVFLLTAAVSGGSTFAVLSDSVTVTTTITVGNAPAGTVSVTAETSDPVSTAGNTPTSAPGTRTNVSVNESDTEISPTETLTQDNNTSENDTEASRTETPTATPVRDESGFGNVTVALEPADRTAESNGVVVYDVVVENATDGIAGYELRLELSNTSVATFEGFTITAQPEPVTNDSTVTDGVLEVSAYWGSETVDGSDRITVGKLRVATEAAGETDLEIAGPGTQTTVVLNDDYYIGATRDGTLEVTESDESNETS